LTLANIMEPSIHTSKGNYVLDKWFNLIPCYGMSTPTLFQWQVINESLASRRPNMGFHAWATRALEQTEMETCCVLMATQHLFLPIGNHAPRNMNLKTRTSKPNTHWNMSSFGKGLNVHFDAQVAQAPEIYHTKTSNENYFLAPSTHLPCSPNIWSPSMMI
jgi:hypothetical protein